MTEKTSPIRPTDQEARNLAYTLLATSSYGSLGVIDENGAPMVTRVAVGLSPTGQALTLVSDLSHHTQAMRTNPSVSLLVGEPGSKGDPLTHPRLTLQATCEIVEHKDPGYTKLAEHYLKTHPKSKLYIGFGDFVFAKFNVERAFLNGGFGKAFVLTPEDLGRGKSHLSGS